jgi:HK97 family phage prohead protease
MIERMTFAAEVKADTGAEGVVEGYASVFNVQDRGGDIVTPGAFAASLTKGRPLMFFGHDPDRVLGVWDEVAEDDRGLRARGRINMEKQLGRDVMSDIRMGALRGLSIGYRVQDREIRGATRLLKQVDLVEISAVALPMNGDALIDAVKAADMTEREFERLLTQDAGLSRSVARRLMADGFKAIRATQDADRDADAIRTLLTQRIAAATL